MSVIDDILWNELRSRYAEIKVDFDSLFGVVPFIDKEDDIRRTQQFSYRDSEESKRRPIEEGRRLCRKI